MLKKLPNTPSSYVKVLAACTILGAATGYFLAGKEEKKWLAGIGAGVGLMVTLGVAQSVIEPEKIEVES